MDKYKQLLFESSRPFMIVTLNNDTLKVKEKNIETNTVIESLNIEDNSQIKGLIKRLLKQEVSKTCINEVFDGYKLEIIKLDEEEVMVWFDIKDDKADITENNFVQNLTHEFKTPLSLIFNSLQLIEQKIELDNDVSSENIKTYLGIIERNSNRILKLVNNISDSNKAKLGYIPYNPVNENIINCIEGVCELLGPFVKSNNMYLVFDTDIEELTVAFDVEKIESIILNLVSNAIKFRKSKNGKININITHSEENIHIKVRDNGIGMSKENISQIFNRYVRINDKRSLVKEGSGIGLSIVESLVHLHDGSICVDSCLGEWTEFHIVIPNIRNSKLYNENEFKDGSGIAQKIKIEFSDI